MQRLVDKMTLGTAALVASALVIGVTPPTGTGRAGAPLNGVPVFKVDPGWPTLPADFTWGQVIGIFADSRGHVWTSSRSRIWQPPRDRV